MSANLGQHPQPRQASLLDFGQSAWLDYIRRSLIVVASSNASSITTA